MMKTLKEDFKGTPGEWKIESNVIFAPDGTISVLYGSQLEANAKLMVQ